MKRTHKLLSALLTLVMLLGMIPAAFAAQPIDKVDLTVVKPVVGKTPNLCKG